MPSIGNNKTTVDRATKPRIQKDLNHFDTSNSWRVPFFGIRSCFFMLVTLSCKSFNSSSHWQELNGCGDHDHDRKMSEWERAKRHNHWLDCWFCIVLQPSCSKNCHLWSTHYLINYVVYCCVRIYSLQSVEALSPWVLVPDCSVHFVRMDVFMRKLQLEKSRLGSQTACFVWKMHLITGRNIQEHSWESNRV